MQFDFEQFTKRFKRAYPVAEYARRKRNGGSDCGLWIAPDGSKVDEADLKVLNPVFITCSTDLQHIADRHRKNPTMCKPIRKYAAEKGFNIRILDVDAPLRAMNTLKMFAQKALSDFNGYSAACLANDKFCQKFIDMMDVLDGKELLTDTIEE